jgi:hypothetical protein
MLLMGGKIFSWRRESISQTLAGHGFTARNHPFFRHAKTYATKEFLDTRIALQSDIYRETLCTVNN